MSDAPIHHSTSSFSASDGLTIFHQSWTPAETPRSNLIVVHGLGEHSGRYGHVAEALVRAGHAVHALDHRGHGRSSGRRTFVRSYGEFLRDLHQFRRLVERDDVPTVVLGHSMGGNIATGYALAEGADLAALVLSGPALHVGDDFSPGRLAVFRAIARVAPAFRPQGLPADAISRDPEVVAAYLADPLVFTGKVTAGLGAALIGAMQSFPGRYHELRMPILLLHGTEDRLADIAGSRALEAGAVDAEVTAHYYEGLYHEVFNEPEQDRVIGDLIAWLDTRV
ncbi:MAG: alpha/beta hydrolase [Ilumatobacteraceae bacterium]